MNESPKATKVASVAYTYSLRLPRSRGSRSRRRALARSAGVSMIVAPARNAQDRIVGAIGVIGPTRINYGRIIPVVDYTARVIGRLLG